MKDMHQGWRHYGTLQLKILNVVSTSWVPQQTILSNSAIPISLQHVCMCRLLPPLPQLDLVLLVLLQLLPQVRI